jgi:hypothetical protein
MTEKTKVKISFYCENKIVDILKIEADKQGRNLTELLKEATIKLLKDYRVDF